MKRYIRAASKSEIKYYIVNKFKKNGCLDAKIVSEDNSYFKVKLTLPNGNTTETTVWVESSRVKNGTRASREFLDWDSSWTINNGHAYDTYGQEIGRVIVVHEGDPVRKYKKSYHKKSARINSGDITIDHLKSDKDVKQVIQDLQSRVIVERS